MLWYLALMSSLGNTPWKQPAPASVGARWEHQQWRPQRGIVNDRLQVEPWSGRKDTATSTETKGWQRRQKREVLRLKQNGKE